MNQFAVEDATIEPMVTIVANDNWMYTRFLQEVDKSSKQIQMASATSEIVAFQNYTLKLIGSLHHPKRNFFHINRFIILNVIDTIKCIGKLPIEASYM